MHQLTARAALGAALLTGALASLPAAAQAPAATPQVQIQSQPIQIQPAAPAVDWQTATELHKVDFTGLSEAQKTMTLKILREEGCGCGCGMKIAQCRVQDKNCPVSPGLAADIIASVKAGKTDAAIRAEIKEKAAKRPTPPPPPATLGPKVEIPTTGAPSKGPANAKVTIVEFSDFQCPYCSQAIAWADSILKEFPNDVRLVFKQYPLPFHNQAKLAAEASLAAHEQGKFWEMHDKMFANFKTLSRENIETWAKEIGLDVAKLKKALDEGKYTKTVEQDMADGSKVGVSGTPSFFIGGHRYNGGRSLEAVKPVIQAVMKGDVSEFQKAPPAPTPPPALGEKVEIPITGAPSKGPANAKVTLVEFSDFQCPYCSQAIAWVDQIAKAYPNDVRVVFKQYPLPFHKQAKIAAEASLAANEQGKFWEMHDKLFANFRTLSRENIDAWAAEIGLDVAKFKQALDSGKFTKVAEQDMADGQKVGVTGTPSFFLNGKRYNGGRTLDAIKPLIDEELKGGVKTAAAGSK